MTDIIDSIFLRNLSKNQDISSEQIYTGYEF